MKYKLGDQVVVKVETPKIGKKRILTRAPLSDSVITEQAFPIVIIDEVCEWYTIILDDDMQGWQIGEFHVMHCKVDKSLVLKRYYDITDSLILRKKRGKKDEAT